MRVKGRAACVRGEGGEGDVRGWRVEKVTCVVSVELNAFL